MANLTEEKCQNSGKKYCVVCCQCSYIFVASLLKNPLDGNSNCIESKKFRKLKLGIIMFIKACLSKLRASHTSNSYLKSHLKPDRLYILDASFASNLTLANPKINKGFFNRDATKIEREGQQTTPYFLPLF